MLNAYFLGVDVGTSNIKAVLFDENGEQLGIKCIECTMQTTLYGFAELAPKNILEASFIAIRGVVDQMKGPKEQIRGIGFSCHMHSLMAVDEEGEPLTPVMIWADTRAIKEADDLENRFDTHALYLKTGSRVGHPMYPVSKLLWMKNAEPKLFEKAYKWVTVKEYILFHLFGEWVVDYSMASGQGYFNLHTMSWDQQMMDILGISPERLCQPVPCTYTFKKLKTSYGKMLGLSEEIVGVIGSGDGMMANIGCGVFDECSVSSTIGTSGALRTTVKKPLLDTQQRTWCYAFTDDQWVVGGAINNGGLVLKWLRDNFKEQFQYDAKEYGESIYQLFDRFLVETSPASDGLIFLPYLTGERSPDWKAEVRGLMYGLDYSHTKKHIVRAAMEGVMYRLYSVYEVLHQITGHVDCIKANGGYIKSDMWLQIQGDLFNKEIQISKVAEASALGAAFVTMATLGYADMESPLPAMDNLKIIRPNLEHHQVYMEAYRKAQDIYHRLYS